MSPVHLSWHEIQNEGTFLKPIKFKVDYLNHTSCLETTRVCWNPHVNNNLLCVCNSSCAGDSEFSFTKTRLFIDERQGNVRFSSTTGCVVRSEHVVSPCAAASSSTVSSSSRSDGEQPGRTSRGTMCGWTRRKPRLQEEEVVSRGGSCPERKQYASRHMSSQKNHNHFVFYNHPNPNPPKGGTG